MYVQPTADKMAASEYSRLVNTQSEANRMDPHNHHQMSPMYPGQKQVVYQSSLRGSIQTGMPSVPHGMDMGKNHPHKSVASESNRRGPVGYSSAQHLVQRGGYPHGYQHQVNYQALSSAVTSETSPFRREHPAMASHAEIMRSHNQMNQKSANVFQTTHRSDASHLHKSYDQINHGFQSHIGSLPRATIPGHQTSVAGNIKDLNPSLKSHPQSYASTQMHLNYQHESVPISGLSNHPGYVSVDRRHSTNKPSSHIGYHDSQRVAGDSQRLGPSNPLSAMPELIRVVDEPNSRIQSSLRQPSVLNQSHRMGHPHRTDHALPSSIHKDHNRPSFSQKSIPSGQPSVFVSQDYSNPKVVSSARRPSKESQHGSIQTGIPLDLSRVPEKPTISVNQKTSRETDSPLDLSIKTRKRCADTTINQYSNDAGIISPKRQLVEHKQVPHNSITEHYRNDFQKSIDPMYLNQAVQQQHRQQSYQHLPKEPVTVKADNSAAKSAGLLPRLTPEQSRANIIYQNQKQLNSLKAQTAKSAQDATVGGVSPYPYSLYPGNQPSIIRCSPDSTNAQVYQHHQQSKQVQQLLKRTPLTQSTTTAQYEQQQSLHNQKLHSPKGSTRHNKVDTLHVNHQQRSHNFSHTNSVHIKAMSLPAMSRSQQVTHPPSVESKPGHVEFIRSSNNRTSLPLTKPEPHMQLYPSYEKQSFTGTLPSNINLNRANSASTSNIYKTHVKPPEIMGLPSTDTEKHIVNTIKSVRNDEKPKTVEPKNPLGDTASNVAQTDLEQGDKYMEPLSIAIPFAKDSTEKTQKVLKSGDDKIIAPVPPKVLSRKQMIMNAVIKDENLKKYATPMRKPRAGSEFKAPRSSPASPPSPKMPILSPQQKSLPSVSPLHSDPPTLDLLENPGKQRLKGRISHTIQKRPLDKVKAPIVKIPTENQETVPNSAKEEPKETSYQRPEALRRNSLPEKTWMYNKNIPVANVAPFVHSEVKEEKFSVGTDSQPTLAGSINESDKTNEIPSQDDEQKANSTRSDTPSPVANAKEKERSSIEKVVVKAKLKNISARKKLALEKMKNNIVGTINDLKDSEILTKIEPNSAKVPRKSKSEKRVKSELPDGPSLEEDVAAIDDAEAAGNLMTDPALLDREERALRRAIDQFNKMETGTKYPSSATTMRRQSNTNKRAQELKKRAINRNSTSGRNKNSRIKGRSGLRSRGFIDFKPEVLKSRTRPTDEKQIRKRVSSSKNHRTSSRPRQDSDFEFDNGELDFLDDDDDDDEEYDDDDDEDATEYEYDSDELSQDRVLRQRVSLRTRKRPARHVDSDDSDAELDLQDDIAIKPGNKPSRTRRQQKLNSRTEKRAAKVATDAANHSEETTDDDFDAAFFHHEESSLLIPAEVKKITINKTTGETGLHKAVRLNYQEAVMYYLKSGTLDVNVKDNAGYSPLHEACSTGNLPVAKILLRHGADVNSSSLDGIRPLHDAVRSDHIEIVRLLLAFSADPTIPDGTGKNLVEISELPGMVRFIEGYFGDLNGFDSDVEDNPWQFSSCCSSGPVENGCNIFSDIPSDPEQDLEEDLFDDDITSAIRIFDLDLYNIGRSESYVFGEDIQSQFNCNETRLRKLCTPEMDVIKLPTEKFQKFFDNSVVRCPLTNNPTIYLIKYTYYKDLKEKLTPTTKCSNVSDLISYRNKATERKVLNRSLTHNSDSSTKHGKKNSKGETKSASVVKDAKSDSRQNKGQNSKYSLQQSSSCPSRLTVDSNEATCSSQNNNNNNSNQVNNNINNVKKRQSHMSVQVVLKKEMLTSLSGKKSSKLESFKIRTPSTSSLESKNTNSKSISAVASSKYAFNDGDSN